MNAKKVIIDCDPGIDDALALMLALRSPELEILGITVVSGNVPAKKGASNAQKVLHWMNRPDIPVYLGEELPLVRPYVDAMDTHGEDGLGESHYPEITDGTINTDGVGFLARTLHEAAQKEEPVSIIALGPLTNLARLVQNDPESLAGRILAEIHVGGAVEHNVGSLQQRVFRHRFGVHGDHISLDHLHGFQNPVGQFGATVEFTFVANDLLRSLQGTLNRRFAGKAYNLVVFPFAKQRNHKRTADQTGDPGQKDLLHQSPSLFFVSIEYKSLTIHPNRENSSTPSKKFDRLR